MAYDPSSHVLSVIRCLLYAIRYLPSAIGGCRHQAGELAVRSYPTLTEAVKAPRDQQGRKAPSTDLVDIHPEAIPVRRQSAEELRQSVHRIAQLGFEAVRPGDQRLLPPAQFW